MRTSSTVFLTTLILVSWAAKPVSAFVPVSPIKVSSETTLFSSPPPRKARRDLQKRRKQKRQGQSIPAGATEDFWQNSEVRPLVKGNAIEQGEDYWVPEEDMKREQERDAARIAGRPQEQVSDEKLWSEVLSPYKQNWIGLISVTIVALAFIIKNFPEMTETPVITLPDL